MLLDQEWTKTCFLGNGYMFPRGAYVTYLADHLQERYITYGFY